MGACALFLQQRRQGKGGHNSLRGTLFTSENYVRGDIIHRGTIFTLTPVVSELLNKAGSI